MAFPGLTIFELLSEANRNAGILEQNKAENNAEIFSTMFAY